MCPGECGRLQRTPSAFLHSCLATGRSDLSGFIPSLIGALGRDGSMGVRIRAMRVRLNLVDWLPGRLCRDFRCRLGFLVWSSVHSR